MPTLKTFCSICNPHSHCGINALVEKGELVEVEGMPDRTGFSRSHFWIFGI